MSENEETATGDDETGMQLQTAPHTFVQVGGVHYGFPDGASLDVGPGGVAIVRDAAGVALGLFRHWDVALLQDAPFAVEVTEDKNSGGGYEDIDL